MIEIGIVHLLNNTPAITALVGTAIYPTFVPENAAIPAIVFKLVGSQSTPSFSTRGFQRKRFEFSCYSTSYLQALEIREALIQTLDCFTGLLSDGSFVSSTVRITGTDLEIPGDMQYCNTVEFYFSYVPTE